MVTLTARSSRRGVSEPADGAPFLGDAEFARFVEAYERFPRKITTWTLRESTAELRPQLLTKVVLERTRELIGGRAGTNFRCLLIRVRSGDGMSWSASAVDRALWGETDVSRLHLCGQPAFDHLPEIARLIGARALARLAQRHHLTSSFRSLGWPARAFIVVASVTVGAITTLLTALTKAPDARTVDLLAPSFLLPAIGLTVVGLPVRPPSRD
jgi:hypothetical protein